MLKKLIIFILILSAITSFGQNFKEEKRIYVLDITGSMWGAGGAENIFDDVKNNLIETINALDNTATDVTVITFGKKVINKWHVKGSDKGKKEVISHINDIEKFKGQPLRKATNICAALGEANNEINPERLNYIFLFTDGGHNHPSNNLACVENIVNQICSKNSGIVDVYPFYIMLTKSASSPELIKVLNCFTIPEICKTPVIINVYPERNSYAINLIDNQLSTTVNFTSNDKFSLAGKTKVVATLKTNDLFTLNKKEYILSPKLGSIVLEFVSKQNLSLIQAHLPLHSSLELSFNINYAEKVDPCKTVNMQPKNILIDVVNEREKTVTISVMDEEK